MTIYSVFPGMALNYNDFHMEYFDSGFVPGTELLAIDHCREGRMEYAAGENTVSYMGAGDMKLDRRRRHTGRFVFPTGHYHGLTVALELAAARRALQTGLKDFRIDVDRILEKVALGEYPRVIHRAAVMERVFSEMYQVPQTIRLPYPASAKNCLYYSSVNSRLKSAPARPMAFDRPLVEPLSVRFM